MSRRGGGLNAICPTPPPSPFSILLFNLLLLSPTLSSFSNPLNDSVCHTLASAGASRVDDLSGPCESERNGGMCIISRSHFRVSGIIHFKTDRHALEHRRIGNYFSSLTREQFGPVSVFFPIYAFSSHVCCSAVWVIRSHTPTWRTRELSCRLSTLHYTAPLEYLACTPIASSKQGNAIIARGRGDAFNYSCLEPLLLGNEQQSNATSRGQRIFSLTHKFRFTFLSAQWNTIPPGGKTLKGEKLPEIYAHSRISTANTTFVTQVAHNLKKW